MDFLDAVFISFWHQIEVFIDKFSLWSLNLSQEEKKLNFRFWVLVPTIGTVKCSLNKIQRSNLCIIKSEGKK